MPATFCGAGDTVIDSGSMLAFGTLNIQLPTVRRLVFVVFDPAATGPTVSFDDRKQVWVVKIPADLKAGWTGDVIGKVAVKDEWDRPVAFCFNAGSSRPGSAIFTWTAFRGR
ncbi:MAG: hypothetical protein J7521_20810 [Caulobacter sp.]|nr:hypothetical protein [Caulobacter sp.]